MNELKFTWAEAGPIIEREGITISQNYGSTTWWAVHPRNELEVHGATALEAAMRAYWNQMVDEMLEADSAGWTIAEIAEEFGVTRQQVVDIFLKYERYEPNDPELSLDDEPPEPEFPEPRGKLLRDYTIDDFNPKMRHWSDQ